MKKAARIILIVLILAWVCLYVGSVWENYEAAVAVKLDPLILEEFDIDEDTAKGLVDATQVVSEHREHELNFPAVGKEYLFGIRQTLAVKDGICMLLDVYFPEDIYEKITSGEYYIGHPEFYLDEKLYNDENCNVTAKMVSEEKDLFCRTYILTYSGGELEFEPFTSDDTGKEISLRSSHFYSKDGRDLCDEYGLFSNSSIGWTLCYIDFDLSVK